MQYADYLYENSREVAYINEGLIPNDILMKRVDLSPCYSLQSK